MYIDPGAGSLILQVLIAGALSAVAVAGRARNAVKEFVRSILSHRR
jgi:hypothetical protein